MAASRRMAVDSGYRTLRRHIRRVELRNRKVKCRSPQTGDRGHGQDDLVPDRVRAPVCLCRRRQAARAWAAPTPGRRLDPSLPLATACPCPWRRVGRASLCVARASLVWSWRTQLCLAPQCSCDADVASAKTVRQESTEATHHIGWPSLTQCKPSRDGGRVTDSTFSSPCKGRVGHVG
jgi:hypothetical protein